MEKTVFQGLLYLKEKQKNGSLEVATDKVLEEIEKINNCEGKLREKYIYLKVLKSSLKCILYEEIRKGRIRKELKEILNCADEDIVYDENDIRKNEKATIVAGSIRYSASLSKKHLENKKIIWGDLDIRALDDTSCLQNLELVGGNLLLGNSCNLPNLKYVFGSVNRSDNITFSLLRYNKAEKCIKQKCYTNK